MDSHVALDTHMHCHHNNETDAELALFCIVVFLRELVVFFLFFVLNALHRCRLMISRVLMKQWLHTGRLIWGLSEGMEGGLIGQMCGRKAKDNRLDPKRGIR